MRLRPQLIERREPARERRGAVRRLVQERLDLGREDREIVLERGPHRIAERLRGLGARVDGDDIHAARTDARDRDLEAPERVRERRGHPVHAAVLAKRDGGAGRERLHERTPDIVRRVRGEEALVALAHRADEVVIGRVAAEEGRDLLRRMMRASWRWLTLPAPSRCSSTTAKTSSASSSFPSRIRCPC